MTKGVLNQDIYPGHAKLDGIKNRKSTKTKLRGFGTSPSIYVHT